MSRPYFRFYCKMSGKTKVLVALSGGVDSAVSALLLKNAGHDVAGVYMRTWMNEEASDVFADCPWKRDLADAQAVAEHLEIPFTILNMIEDYRKKVVNYLVEGYERGITPNPDIACNREIKFGVLMDYALEQGFDALATGHYVRKRAHANGSCDLLEGLDKNKDQSYFLALLTQQQIQRALFPIGDLHKTDVRSLALQHGLPVASKKDSQGICFLGKVAINEFLAHYLPDKPGPIINLDGKELGMHKGLHRYTPGQRKGIGVPSNMDFENYVVISKDLKNNRLIVAFDRPETPGLYTHTAQVYGISWMNRSVTQPCTLLAKPRYRDPSTAITFCPLAEPAGSARLEFGEPQRALASGQVVALYDGETLLGGGFYE
ncbi:MAG TPA: tRNA 2-thiouridine(34) synthase MnmA [Opitutales bacterium]|nr:tRNA 2-thiouridine(34) synthase MnmA [Opitutales bacterium]